MSELMIEIAPGIKVLHGGPTHREFTRLRAIEAAAREVVGETVLVGDHDDSFATFDQHFVMVEKYAVEALRAALEGK